MPGGRGQAPVSGAQRQDKGQRAQTAAQEVPSEDEEELLYLEGGTEPRERLCSLLLWGHSHPPGRDSVQPAPGDPALAGGD